MITQRETEILRELAKKYAECAADPVNAERALRARDINDCKARRPMVWIDEIPWFEMDIDNQLALHCEDDFARWMENYFRKKLFGWKYFQADMILEDTFYIDKSCTDSGIGMSVTENTIATDKKNNIISHMYLDQLDTDEKLAQLHCRVIKADKVTDQNRMAAAEEILRGILPVRLRGRNVNNQPWDEIPRYRGVETVLFDLIERPEFMHKIIAKFTEIRQSEMLQLESEGLLDFNIATLHCTPPQTSDLPAKDYDGKNVRLKDIWYRGMAQMFSSVSPDMFEEFELDYARPLMAQCGLVYYGCCEPLDLVIPRLKTIPNLRKVGVSPWSNVNSCAEQLGSDYVFARKPNPAMVAGTIDKQAIEREITETIEACHKNNCAYEFVLKDISTVGNKPANLIEWNQITQSVIDRYYK